MSEKAKELADKLVKEHNEDIGILSSILIALEKNVRRLSIMKQLGVNS
jgi:hypothetical protein